MQLIMQIYFKEHLKEYQYLKENSWYIKDLNRGVKNFQTFSEEMKEKYKERTTDKLNSVIENMGMISSVLDILK